MNKRLLSLDVLRGADIFFLVGLQPVLLKVLLALDIDFLNNTLLYQLDHARWEGFRLWDLVMPLFLLMSGVTMPFSLPKYLEQNGNRSLWQRVIKRFIILYALGILVQGNILALDPKAIYLYSNTLQAIAVGYLLTVPLTIYLKPKWQIVSIIVLLIIYTIPMTLFGDWSPQGNFGCKVDKLILGRFRDMTTIDTDGNIVFCPWFDYTYIWSSLTFCCTVAMGSLCGTFIKTRKDDGNKTTLTLLIIGISLVIFGLIWGQFQPIIKRLWTSSMTLFSGGLCIILLAIFYWWIDIKGHNKNIEWLQVYGCNAIIAYIMGEKINFRSIPNSLLYGLEQYCGAAWYEAILTFFNSAIIFLILYILYKNKKFIKI